MSKKEFRPKAYLSKIRNVKTGLESRTKIIISMEKGAATVSDIAKKSRLSYGCTLHHLKIMNRERLVDRSGKREASWLLTQFGQQRL
jgi:predicted transcriptional regulator